jgi:GNAT superfamily N-acetyltransferase
VLFEVLRVHLEYAVSSGWVWLADNGNGVAVWLPGRVAPPPGYDGRLAAAASAYAFRFQYLAEAFGGRRPRRSHLLLTFLAVAPARQRHGIGSALLAWQHRALDRGGTPAYLEASSVASRQLYLRHGYRDHGRAIDLPGGPRVWPMIREPRHPMAPQPPSWLLAQSSAAAPPLTSPRRSPASAAAPPPPAASPIPSPAAPSPDASPAPLPAAPPSPSPDASLLVSPVPDRPAPVVPWERL